MRTQILSKAGALTSGASLWVLPDSDASEWICKLDWYLGFQVARSYSHGPFYFPPALRELTARLNVPVPQVEIRDHAPLLIGTQRLLPNDKTMVVPFHGQRVEDWILLIIDIWAGLSKPTLRIFLPSKVNVGEAQFFCSKLERSESISFVSDYL